jgi:hypothetical protein
MPTYPGEDRPEIAAANVQVAFEDLISQVRECEREWVLDDRLDLAVRLEASRRQKLAGGSPA